jgi:hypothetical protein
VDPIKSATGHVMLHLYFCIWCDLRVTYCILVRLWYETSTHYFSCLGGLSADTIKSMSGHVTPNFYFYIQFDLRATYCVLVRPGHEAYTLFFMLGCARCES